MISHTVQIQNRNPAINYEFVNSLTSVRSLSELLLDYPGMDDRHRVRFLSVIQQETGRLMRLLERLTPETGMTGSL